MAATVRETANVQADVKWPNDVIVGDRKMAGVLAQRATPEADSPPSFSASASTSRSAMTSYPFPRLPPLRWKVLPRQTAPFSSDPCCATWNASTTTGCGRAVTPARPSRCLYGGVHVTRAAGTRRCRRRGCRHRSRRRRRRARTASGERRTRPTGVRRRGCGAPACFDVTRSVYGRGGLDIHAARVRQTPRVGHDHWRNHGHLREAAE